MMSTFLVFTVVFISSNFQEDYLIEFWTADENKTKFIFLTYVQLRISHVTTFLAIIQDMPAS